MAQRGRALDVLDQHGYASADNKHAGRAILLISDLAHIYQGALDHPFGPVHQPRHPGRNRRCVNRAAPRTPSPSRQGSQDPPDRWI